jgi:hypothetical protein
MIRDPKNLPGQYLGIFGASTGFAMSRKPWGKEGLDRISHQQLQAVERHAHSGYVEVPIAVSATVSSRILL